MRRAFNFAFDFEEMNKQIFFGQYKRIASYFEGTELASSGMPEGKELEILQSVKDKVPADLFSKPYSNPVGGNPQAVRDNFRQALALFREAGYEIKDTKLVNAKTGEQFSVEFLVDDPSTERFVLFYKPSLERIGMAVTSRVVDAAQYENRLRQWDYDIIVGSWGQSLSPGNEQRDFWSSQAADQPGSRNLIGIKNPAVDALIERVIFSKDRDDLVAATKALDRVLLWNYYVVPQWTYGKHAHRALGSLRPSREHAEIRRPRHSRPSGGGTRTRRPRRRSALDHAPASACRVGGRARRREICAGRRARCSRTPRHVGLRRSRLSGGLSVLQIRQSGRAERRRVLADRTEPAVQPVVPDLQFAQQLTFSRAMPPRAWN